MKLNALKPGDYFQFSRSNGPAIHQAVDPASGAYMTVGQYVRGVPRLFCTRGDCERHLHPRNGKDRPERAVRQQKIQIHGWPEGMDDHEYLDTLERIEDGLAAIRAEGGR